MAALYADEDFPLPTVVALRHFGHDVLTVQDDERANRSIFDLEVLDRAVELNRCILTKNRRDFVRIHLGSSLHSGIIVCTEDNNFEALAIRIHFAISKRSDLSGQLIRVNRTN